MINCPKCGADNMVGAIFCRTCGEKLNIHELSPDVFDAPPEPVGAKVAKIIQRVVILVVLVGVAALVAGLFYPVKVTVTGTLDEKESAVAARKYAALQAPTPRTPSQIPFSSAEATAVVNNALGLPSSDAGSKKPELLSVEFLAAGSCRFVLKTLVFGKLPMYTVVVAKPKVTTPGDVQFDIVSAGIGKVRLPGPLRKRAIGQFTALNVGSVFAAAESHVGGVLVTGNSCNITVKLK